MRPYNGNHKKIIAYGAVADDGRQLFRMHKRFDGPTFLLYVRELYRKFGRVAMLLCDRASQQHRTKTLGEFLGKKKNTDVRLAVFLPKGSPVPDPSRPAGKRASASFWHQSIMRRLQ